MYTCKYSISILPSFYAPYFSVDIPRCDKWSEIDIPRSGIVPNFYAPHLRDDISRCFPDSTLRGNAELGDNNQVAVALVWLGNNRRETACDLLI